MLASLAPQISTPSIGGFLADAAAAGVTTTSPATASATPLAPVLMLALCVVGGVGTLLLLPGRREASVRRIGAVVLATAALVLAALLMRWTAADARGGMGFYFWLFSAVALGGAVRVITHSQPVYSALYFVLTVFATAGLFVLLWAEFMAVALVLIYAGAVLVTYVFVIMLASEVTAPSGVNRPYLQRLSGDGSSSGGAPTVADHDAVSREPVAACAIGFGLMAVILLAVFDKYQTIARPGTAVTEFRHGTTQELGAFLFSHHIVSLELGGLILTIAMVGAIMIARRRVVAPEPHSRGGRMFELKPEAVVGPATPVDDNPHSIPVEGTRNPMQKAYPEK